MWRDHTFSQRNNTTKKATEGERVSNIRGLHKMVGRNPLSTMLNRHTNHEMEYSSEYGGLFFTPYYSTYFLTDALLVVYDTDFTSCTDDNIIYDVGSNLDAIMSLQELPYNVQ